MKKIFTLLTAVALFSSTSFGQTQYGAAFGLNMSNITGDSPLDDTGLKPGLRIGLDMKKELSYTVNLHTGLIYSVKGATGEMYVELYDGFTYYSDYVDADITLSYLEIPVNFGFVISDKFSLMAGFYSAFLLDAELSSGSESASLTDITSSIDFGLGFGA